MIYTVTFNPSLDYVMHVEDLMTHSINKSHKEEVYPGGKGINVSIVLHTLRIPNKAFGFVAGFSGKEIERSLSKLGVHHDFITLDNGFSRINVKLKAKGETDINGSGPQITPSDLRELFEKLNELKEGDYLVLAGSIPPNVPHDIYQTIIKELSSKNIFVIVDATKELLLNVLPYKPFLIKPNQEELGELFGVTLHTKEEVIAYGKKLLEKGAQNVLISRGSEGALLLTNDGQILDGTIPDGKLVSSVGAGDSMIAGFIAGYIKSHSFDTALKLSLATGSATAYSSWLATPDQIDDLLL
ncbi:1-phosphofructokinase [Sporanaerobium hydrogeniformans]|uniref:1-phosphofructokinase n=1 Tax=Sporanaerobium hydrogeniformans TaxID=3072179 RepID=A0AC61DCA0_9FIRM|nr:1-phosphofructokinase [Sporanaerobium hydrogeniformans]PHV70311.1 1-phosphofructokinase [Sporanaerobium hydrogeniformans]